MLKPRIFLPFFLIALQLCVAMPCYPNLASDVMARHLNVFKKRHHHRKTRHKKIADYPYNPHVDVATWDRVKPYFLPIDHPIKTILDTIFQSDRVTLSRENFAAAGFTLNAPKDPGNLVVGKHSLLQGYLVKAYLDNQYAFEWGNFIGRITGAESIQKCIEKHHYEDLFRVPKKWIYPLPLDPSPPEEENYHRKNFILIVEEMPLLDHHQNAKAFKNKITPQILDALYVIIHEEGLIDSVFRGNIPFDSSGKLNFIDTEHHHLSPIPYEHLTRYLSPEMQMYWQNLYTQSK